MAPAMPPAWATPVRSENRDAGSQSVATVRIPIHANDAPSPIIARPT
jgi:hypothetical protein